MHLPEPPVRFAYGSHGLVMDGRFLIFGGDKQRKGAFYDPASAEWQTMTDIPFDTSMSSVALVNGKLLVWSGYEKSADAGGLYDFTTKKWSRISHPTIAKRPLAFTSVAGDKVIVFGGWDPSRETFLTDGAAYDVGDDDWQPIEELPARVPYLLHPGW